MRSIVREGAEMFSTFVIAAVIGYGYRYGPTWNAARHGALFLAYSLPVSAAYGWFQGRRKS